jgi:hypothetical protein
MTVEILRLSGLEAAEAEQAASTLLDLRTGPRDLRNLLVLDDTALVVEHAPAYVGLDTAARVEDMLCVAVGPRAGNGRGLRLPGNLGGTQGSPVLWVSDPSGIDWRVAAAAIALGHPPGRASGLDLLVELLSVEDMFKRVHRAVVEKVPGRVASPGLRLAGADDEAATFAAALATAIRRLCDPGQGADGPFPALLPAQIGGASLTEGGTLAGYRDEVAESVAAASGALRKLTGLGGRFRHGDGGAQTHLVEAGAALTDLRDLVARLLQEANTVGELTGNQRRLVSDAGIRFPPGSPPPSSAQAPGSAAEQSPVYRTIAEAVRGGDTLALVTRRLTLTERELKRLGSASYLHEVEERCSSSLLGRLADPPQRLPRRVDAEARDELGLDDALRAADALEKLVVAVANREWSPAVAFPGEVARIRVALDGVCKALTEHATAAGSVGTARGARLARLGDTLTPVLRDLVLRVLAAEAAQPSTGGHEAFATARQRAVGLIADWVLHVQDNGVLSRPSFATSGVHGAVPYTDDDDVAEIREALLYPPRQEMWQLCSPVDLSVLNVAAVPEVVRFASRLNKDALAGTLPGDQPVWTSSGSYAGLLRLVPLRPGFTSSTWGETSSVAEPSSVADPSSVAEPS